MVYVGYAVAARVETFSTFSSLWGAMIFHGIAMFLGGAAIAKSVRMGKPKGKIPDEGQGK